MTKAARSRAAKKGWARRRRKGTARKSTRRRRRAVYLNPPKRRKYKSKRHRRVRMRTKPYSRKYRKGYIRRRRTKRGNWHYRITRNPMTALKGTIKRAIPIYGGMLAVRVACGLIDAQLKKKPQTGFMAKAAPYLPAVATFGLSLFAGKLIKGKPRWVEGIQLGAAFTLFDVVVRQLVKPALLKMESPTMKTVAGALAGYDDMGVQGYGYGAYISDPTGYSLPVEHAGPIGLDVEEAMALGEYVPEGMAGFNVEEALAANEEAYIQTGGAGGSLAKTVFTS
jgi:hypothetical protein